jgi:pimeloyl-ACP methyl ester carboxylesterase
MVLLLVATLLAGADAGASGSPARNVGASQQSSAKPTIVLVHGAFADASSWTGEVQALQARGYPVIAPANPLRGLTSDSDYIRSVLQTVPGPVVLVGHSYGGAVITNAARGASNVVALVYVAAFIPDAGQSIATAYDQAAYPGSLLGPDTTTVRPVANPATPGGQDVDIYIKPESFWKVFAGDQTKSQAAVMAATQRPLTSLANFEPSGAPAWKTIPSWALISLNDKAIAPAGQAFMARRAGATTTSVQSAHDVTVSHPQAVVDLIVRAARR